MGAWGTGLYQDDVACDIKEEYINRLKIGQSNLEATQELINNNIEYINDMEDRSIFWFALADTQWRYGRLLPKVKEEALKHIKSGADLERWQDDRKQYEKRKFELNRLEERLNSAQPLEKKVSKLVLTKANWEVGDILLYQIKNEKLKDSKWYNKYILLRVIGITKTNIGSLPLQYSHEQNIVGIYNWVGNIAPNLSIINKLKFMIAKNIYGRIEEVTPVLSFNNRELKELNIKILSKDNKYKKPSEHIMSDIGKPWYNIHNIDNAFVRILNNAEENKNLMDETKNVI